MFNDLKKMAVGTPRWAGWNLFWWKVEAYECLNGINVYKPSDENSAGFVIRFGLYGFRIRYSKRTGLWHWGFCRWYR